jgi:X-X-X-Leu-X-X-Gly heptad repeat protein
MLEALQKNPKADLRMPTYGTMVIEYFPQYYLAICAVEAGNIDEAQRYLKESQSAGIRSSKLANGFQTLSDKVNSLAKQKAKPLETKPPAQQPQPQQQVQPQKAPPKKDPEPVKPVVPDHSAAIKAALREGRAAFNAGRYEDARSAANRVIGMQPDNREARSLLSDIASRQAAEAQAREKEQQIREAEQALRRGDLGTAENLALALKIQYPSDPSVRSILQQIDKQKGAALQDLKADQIRKSAEKEVLTAYYSGNYNQAIELAKKKLNDVPQNWRLHFFLGCSYAALSMLEEKDADSKLQLAREYFRRARSISGSPTLPPHISPKIIEVYRSS